MDRGAWQATVHEVAKSWTRLFDFFTLDSIRYTEKSGVCDSFLLKYDNNNLPESTSFAKV